MVGDGGGHGAIACDQVDAAGLELPVLSPATFGRDRGGLPSTAATGNPVDLAGGGEQDFMSYRQGRPRRCSTRGRSMRC